MKKVSRKLSRFLAGALTLGLLCGTTVLPSSAQPPTLTLDRQEYIQGDEILAHYTGAGGKDWIAIYKDGEEPGGPAATVYEYTSKTGQPDGTMDFKEPDRGDIKELAPGDYTVYLLKDDGYEILAQAAFTMKGSAGLSADKTSYPVGQRPVFQYTGSTHPDSWLGVYAADNNTPGTGNPALVWQYTRFYGQPDGSTELESPDSSSPTTMAQLPPGEYCAYLFADGGYTVLAACTFTLEARDPAACPAPAGVRYDRTAGRRGYADGTVSVRRPADAEGLTGYRLYWADEEGPLPDYTYIPVEDTGEDTVFHQLNDNTIIPSGATRLLAYAVYDGDTQSPAAAACSLPSGSAAETEEPLYSFQVFSDTHIQSDPNHLHNRHLRMALADIQQTDPDSIGIFHVGDVTDNGETGQFLQYTEIVNSFDDLPYIYCTPGNHDLRNETYDAAIDRFLENTNAPSGYYSEKIGDATFIMLGSQDLDNWDLDRSAAHLKDDQIQFLKEELQEAADGMQPIFVFLHQPLYNTVSGSLPGQNWHGVDRDAEMREIFKQYPQVIFFTGHTHWELDAKSAMYAGNGTDANMFNDASVGYLWTDEDTGKEGSQGYYVEVYAHKVLVRGRDFETGKWIPAAQFIVDITQNIKGLAARISQEEEGLIARKAQIESLLSDIQSLPADARAAYKAEEEKLQKLLEQAAALEGQATALAADIAALPSPEAVGPQDKAAVNAAYEAYEALNNEQKALLDAAAVQKLTALKALTDGMEDPAVLAGDLDKDGTLTIKDVMEACKVLARKTAGQDPTGDQLLRGDLDGNGDIAINDIMAICRLLARQS